MKTGNTVMCSKCNVPGELSIYKPGGRGCISHRVPGRLGKRPYTRMCGLTAHHAELYRRALLHQDGVRIGYDVDDIQTRPKPRGGAG